MDASSSSSTASSSSREQTRLDFVKALSSAFKEQDNSRSDSASDTTPPKQEKSSLALRTQSSSTAKLHMESAQRLIQTFAKSMEATHFDSAIRQTLVHMFTSELSTLVANPQLLMVPLGTVVNHDLLRQVLLVTNTTPAADEKQDKLLCSQLYLRAVMLAPAQSLPAELQVIKRKHMNTAMREAQSRADARDVESIKLILDEILRAHGEPEYPWHELVERSDPMRPNYKEVGLTMSGSFKTLNLRKPDVFAVMVAVVNTFICKACNEVGYFRFEGPPQLNDSSSVLLPSSGIQVEYERVSVRERRTSRHQLSAQPTHER